MPLNDIMIKLFVLSSESDSISDELNIEFLQHRDFWCYHNKETKIIGICDRNFGIPFEQKHLEEYIDICYLYSDDKNSITLETYNVCASNEEINIFKEFLCNTFNVKKIKLINNNSKHKKLKIRSN